MRAITAKNALDPSLTPAAATEAGDKSEGLEAFAEQRTSTATSIYTTLHIASAQLESTPASQREKTVSLSTMESTETILATPVDGGSHLVTATPNVAHQPTVSLLEQLMIAHKRDSEFHEEHIATALLRSTTPENTSNMSAHGTLDLANLEDLSQAANQFGPNNLVENHITAAIFLSSTTSDSSPIASAHKNVVTAKSGDAPESLSVSQKQQVHPVTTAPSQQNSKSSELDNLPPLNSDHSSITAPSMSNSCQLQNQHCGFDRVTPQTFSSTASISVATITGFSELGINHQTPSTISGAHIFFSSIPTFDSEIKNPTQTIIISTVTYQIPQDYSALVTGSQTLIPDSATTGKNQHISLPVSLERAFVWTSTYSLIALAATESQLNPIDGKTVPQSVFSPVFGPSSGLASNIVGPRPVINPSSGRTAIQKSDPSTSSTLNATIGLTPTAPLKYSGMAAKGRTHLGYGLAVIWTCVGIIAMHWL